MRVSNKSIYDAMQLRLELLSSALKDANEVVTTGKRINRISDDPTGLSQLLTVKSSIGNITQLESNLGVGKTWLTAGDSSLSSINDLILDTKTLSSQLLNGSVNESQRQDAVNQIDGVIRQIFSIGNTQVNGNTIFAGTRTDVDPLQFDNPSNPSRVSYIGDHIAFNVKSEKTANLAVGRDGSKVFWEDTLVVDYSNRKIDFTEDIGLGAEGIRYLTGLLPEGKYTPEQLAVAVRNAMNEASAAYGYNVRYDVEYDADTKAFQIRVDGASVSGYLDTRLLLESGREPTVANVNTGVEANIDIGSMLADAGNGVHNSDNVSFTLAVGGASTQVSFIADTDNDVTRANFLSAINSALADLGEEDLTMDSSDLNATNNTVTLRNASGNRIWVRDSIVTHNASGTFGGNYVGNGFDYNGGTGFGDLVSFDIQLGTTTMASVQVDVDAIGDSLMPAAVTNSDIADAISRELNEGVVMTDGQSVVFTDSRDNRLTITRNGDDFDFATTNGTAFSIDNFVDDDGSGAGVPVALSVTANPGTALASTGAPGTALVSAATPDQLDPVVQNVDTTLLDTRGGSQLREATVTVLNKSALQYGTPMPPGSAPMRFTWGGGEWSVSNNPGYDLPDRIAGQPDSLDLDLDGDAQADIHIDISPPMERAQDFIEFDLLPELGVYSIGRDLGLGNEDVALTTIASDQPVYPLNQVVIDNTNNRIDFEEVDVNGISSGVLTASIPQGTYTADSLATAVRTAMEGVSTTYPPVTYDVTYNTETSNYIFAARGANLSELNIFWNSGPNAAESAAGVLGFFDADDSMTVPVSDNPVTLFSIGGTNDRIDFEEVVAGVSTPLSITITNGDYTSTGDLATEIETRMNAATANGVTYSVTYDNSTRRFTIADSGAVLDELHLLWNSGPNASRSAAEVLGFDNTETAAGRIGGNLLSNGWDDGDTISMDITVGGSTLTFTHTVNVLSDTNESILTELRGQLASNFSFFGNFTREGNTIRFELNNTSMNITNITDSGAGDAQINISADTGTVINPPGGPWIGAGDDITFYAPDDDVVAGVSSFTSDNDVTLVSIDDFNHYIDFEEIDQNGVSSGELTAEIPSGDYTDMASLAAAIESSLEAESSLNVDYTVAYDAASRRFTIRGEGGGMTELRLLWGTGSHPANSAASTLGFDNADEIMAFPRSDHYLVDITIDDSNNRIDFKEVLNGVEGADICELCAQIPNGRYTDFASLTQAIEDAMNGESANFGHQITYDVDYDTVNNKFVIKENGVQLDSLEVLWDTGMHNGTNAAGFMGFDTEDDVASAVESQGETEWGIFNTLFDLKQYLADNDTNGISRSMSRLEAHFEHFKSLIADTGIKYNRIEVKENIYSDLKLSLTERGSDIEDADIVEAIMKLKAKELAYQAALSSSARVMQISLVDYL